MLLIAFTMLFYSINSIITNANEFAAVNANIIRVQLPSDLSIQNIVNEVDHLEDNDIIYIDLLINEEYDLYYRKYFNNYVYKNINIAEDEPTIYLSKNYSEYITKSYINIDEINYKISLFIEADTSYCNIIGRENAEVGAFNIEYKELASIRVIEEKTNILKTIYPEASVLQTSNSLQDINKYNIEYSYLAVVIACILILITYSYINNIFKYNKVFALIGINNRGLIIINFLYFLILMLIAALISFTINLLLNKTSTLNNLIYFIILSTFVTLCNILQITFRLFRYYGRI